MKYSNHAQYINEKCIEVPSVTTILKLLNKPSLCKWANYLGFKRENVDKVLEDSANKGIEVHFMLNAVLFRKQYLYIKQEGVSDDYLYTVLGNFFEWLSGHKLRPFFGETPVTCDKFGGTVDLYCELDGKMTVLDFKTSKNFYSSMFLQLAAYTYMLELKDFEVEQVCILLVNDKMCKHRIIRREELDLYIDTFLQLSDLFYNVYELNKDWGDLLKK